MRWMMAFGTGMALFLGCAADQETAEETRPQQDPAFQNWKDKLSYAVGADLARGLRRQRVDVNVDVMVGAVRDGLAGKKPVMTQEEMTI